MAVIIHRDKGGRRPNRENILATKPNRRRLNGANDVMTVAGVPRGFVARWVNDEKDRLYKYQQAGWEFLTDKGITVGDRTIDSANSETDNGNLVTLRVGMGRDGRPVEAYLMVIEEEFYEEDQAYKQRQIDRTVAAIDRPDTTKGQYKASV